METHQQRRTIKTDYDEEQDILYLLFTDRAEEAIAEETTDSVFVRYSPDSRKVISVEFLDVSSRIDEAFGPERIFAITDRPERILSLPTN